MSPLVKATSVLAVPLGLFCLAVSVSHIIHFRDDLEAFHFGFVFVFGSLGPLFIYCPFRLRTRNDKVSRHLYSLFVATVYFFVSSILAGSVFPGSEKYSRLFSVLIICLWGTSVVLVYFVTLRRLRTERQTSQIK